MLRNGIEHQSATARLFFGTPSAEGTPIRSIRYRRQPLHGHAAARYSETTRSTHSTWLFVDGLPVATFELKNTLTKQTAQDAIEQYKRDRDPRELLFQFGRCLVHFALDDQQVFMCTRAEGDRSVVPSVRYKGVHDGAGNPPAPRASRPTTSGATCSRATASATSSRTSRSSSSSRTRRPRRPQAQAPVLPRYHQLDVVRQLTPYASPAGNRAATLPGPTLRGQRQVELDRLARAPAHRAPSTRGTTLFDSMVVVTDRRMLDKQLQ